MEEDKDYLNELEILHAALHKVRPCPCDVVGMKVGLDWGWGPPIAEGRVHEIIFMRAIRLIRSNIYTGQARLPPRLLLRAPAHGHQEHPHAHRRGLHDGRARLSNTTSEMSDLAIGQQFQEPQHVATAGC